MDSSFRTVEIIGDTVLSNGQNYFVLSRFDLIWGTFVRVDNNYIYYYNINENEEDTIINLSIELNTPYYPESEFAWSVELIEIDTVNIFGINTRSLRYKLDGLILRYVNISDTFGLYHLDSLGEPPGTGGWITDMYYAIIDGKEYGESVSMEKEITIQPIECTLSQNYPNPFNPITKIIFTIPSVEIRDRVSVQLKVYDVLGNEFATLVKEENSLGIIRLSLMGVS